MGVPVLPAAPHQVDGSAAPCEPPQATGVTYFGVAKLLAVTASRLCREYLMGARRAGASWREALQADLAKGAPMLHRWSKDPGDMVPELSAKSGPVHDRAADPVQLLAQYRQEWAGHWNELTTQAAGERLGEVQAALDAMVAEEGLDSSRLHVSAEDVSKVASKFKAGTCAPAGTHPRHLGWFHDLEATACLLNLVTTTGLMPTCEQELLSAQYPKPLGGGRRPIGQFKALYRVWGKCQRHHLRSWQRELDDGGILNTGEGRKVTDCVWRSAVRGETSEGLQRSFLVLLWDLAKAFEKVNHSKLILLARSVKFPAAILRVVVNAFRWTRYVVMDGMVADGVLPDNGVVAGCFAATYALAAYLITDLKAQQERHPEVLLTVHVDDIGQEVSAESAQLAVDQLASSARDLKAAIEQDLDMKLAVAKGTILGNSTAVTDLAQESLRSLGLPPRPPRVRRALRALGGSSMRHLGVDFRAGRRARPRQAARRARDAGVVHGAGPVRRTRVRLGKARLRKALRAVAEVAGCRRIWHTAILPAAKWGGEVTGFTDLEIQELRARGRAHYGHPHASPDIFGAIQPKLDPLGDLAAMGIVRYAEEWWRATDRRQANGRVLTPKELRAAFDCAERDLGQQLPEAGPVGAMLRALKWAGWAALHATSFLSPSVGEVSILRYGPKEVGRFFARDVLRMTEERADAAVASRLEDSAGRGVWWEALRSVIDNRYCSALTKHVLISTTCGTFLTRSLAHKWGYLVQPLCPACGKIDTPAHRVFECGAYEAGRVEQGERWDQAMAACRACEDDKLCSHLLPLRPERVAAPPSAVTRAFEGDDEVPLASFRFAPSEPVAGDGSASTSPLESLRRGGFGVVQWVRATGKLLRLLGTLPLASAQSAVAAEHAAFEAGALHSDGSCTYIGDCNAVLSVGRLGVVSGAAPRSRFASVWRGLSRQDGAFSELLKQKAHVEVTESPESPSEWRAWLNDQADQAAKEAARLHDVHGPTHVWLEDQLARVKKFLYAASRVLESGPAPREEWKSLRRAPARKVPACRIAHEFQQVGPSRWQCTRCLRSKVTPNSALDGKDCRPEDAPPSFQRVAQYAHTHDIEWCELTPRPEAEVGDTLLFCKKCCQYATSKPLGLGKVCPSFGVAGWKRNEAAQHKMRRFLQLKHPKSGNDDCIVAHWPLAKQAYEASRAPEPSPQ